MSRAYEKGIQRAREVVASVGHPAPRTDPRSHAEVESFIKGFGLSAAATRQIVDEWMADRARASSEAYASGAEDASEY